MKTLIEIKYGIMPNKIGSSYATFPKDYKLSISADLFKDISYEIFNDCRTIKTKYEIVIEINGETLYDELYIVIVQKNKNDNDLLSVANSLETRKIKTLSQIFALLKKYTSASFKISYFWKPLHRFVIRYTQSNITTLIPIEAVNELNNLESSSGFKIELDNNIKVHHEDNS